MAMLGGWLSSAGREERAVLRALEELSERKTPLRVDVESRGGSFFSVISLRKNAVLVARPRTMRGGVDKGDWLRLTLPNRDRRQVRVPVVVPHVKLPFSVKHATICGVPASFSGQCQRRADRFSTTRFKNLHLQLTEQGKSFRVLDLSTSGMRIFAGTDTGLMLFEPESEVGPARLRVGDRVRIELDSVVPRADSGQTIGLSFVVARDGASERYLMNLLNRLQETELRRVRVETA